MKQPKKFIQDVIDANYNADDEYVQEPMPRAMGGGSTEPVTIKLTYDEESGQYKANYYAKDLVNMPVAGLKFEVGDTVYPDEEGNSYIKIEMDLTNTVYELHVSDNVSYNSYVGDETEEDVWFLSAPL